RARRDPRGHEIVEAPAVPDQLLEHAPVAGQIAEILVGRGLELGATARTRGRWTGCDPAGGTARCANRHRDESRYHARVSRHAVVLLVASACGSSSGTAPAAGSGSGSGSGPPGACR